MKRGVVIGVIIFCVMSGIFVSLALIITPVAVTPTATPVAQPPAEVTPAPTPDVGTPMAAQDFYEKLHKNPDDFINGTAIVIAGTVASKSEDTVRFIVPWVDFVRGELPFYVVLELNKNELAKVRVGERITAKGEMSGYMLREWAYIKNGRLQ